MSPTAPFLAPERDEGTRQAWAKASGGGIAYSVPGVPGVSIGTKTLGSINNDYYMPVYVASPIIVDQLADEVTSAVVGNHRIGLYRADKNWQPIGAPLADSGDISSNAVQVNTYTPGSAIYLARGRYLTVINCSSNAPSLRSLGGSPIQGSSLLSTLGTTAVAAGFFVSRTYAAFPNPGTAWTTIWDDSVTRNVVFLRTVT